MATVYGTGGNDSIDLADGVTEGSDTIFGYAGSDITRGTAGATSSSAWKAMMICMAAAGATC